MICLGILFSAVSGASFFGAFFEWTLFLILNLFGTVFSSSSLAAVLFGVVFSFHGGALLAPFLAHFLLTFLSSNSSWFFTNNFPGSLLEKFVFRLDLE